MGFFKDLKELSNRCKARKQRREARKQAVNRNPTEEELKDNKKGKLAYIWTIISIIIYVLGFGLVFAAWEENFALGIIALLFSLTITPIAHRKAIELAREQRKINGRGLLAVIVASILPSLVLAGGFFFFVFGGMYIFIK